jgi:pimeloyl-ACP methyl ester carboxylesterase
MNSTPVGTCQAHETTSNMTQRAAFFREAGSGPGVVCVHANASSSRQWRDLMALLAPKFHVFAPDSYDAGDSPSWPSDRVIRLRDEVALIEPVLAKAGSPLALVGHSFGGAVALIAALSNPRRIRAIALYEPTLFSLLDAHRRMPNEAEGIRRVVARAAAALDAGNPDAAAECFLDYWMGAGAWKLTPEPRKLPITRSIINVRRWAHALFTEPSPLAAFRSLEVPVLYMVGKRSTPAALGVARLLTGALPRVEVVEFEDLGHMGPVTHPERVNEVIERFLERTAEPKTPALPWYRIGSLAK